jgi:hypothetical protein
MVFLSNDHDSNTCAHLEIDGRFSAMITYEHGPDRSRFSWDPLTTLVAVRGARAVHTAECSNCDGVNVINATDGTNAWKDGSKSNQTYLVLLDGKAVSHNTGPQAKNNLLRLP